MQRASDGSVRGRAGRTTADDNPWRTAEDSRRRSRLLACACAYGACLLPRERLIRADVLPDAVPLGDGEGWLVRLETTRSFVLVRVEVAPDGAIRSITHPGVAPKRRRPSPAGPSPRAA